MGIKNLKYLIHKYAPDAIVERDLSFYKGKIIAIDISIYLYKYIYVSGSPIELLARQAMKFIKNGITPLYVFDGKPPKEKDAVIDERSEKKKELFDKKNILKSLLNDKPLDGINEYSAFTKEQLKAELEKINKRIIIVSQKILDECKELFTLMGVPFLIANGEAESFAVKMIKEGYVYGCMSEDTDILANGGKIFLRNFNLLNNKILEYDYDKILTAFGIDTDQFIDMCILCGCDYTCTIKNIGIEKAYKFIREYGSIERIINEVVEKNKYYKLSNNFDYLRARELFLTCGEGEVCCSKELAKPQLEYLGQFLTNKGIKKNIKNDLVNILSNNGNSSFGVINNMMYSIPNNRDADVIDVSYES